MATSTPLSTPTSRAGLLSRVLLTLLAAAFLLCAVALIGTYTFLPPLLENLVVRDLRNSLGLVVRPEVDLVSDPPPNMLLGSFEEGG